MRVNLLWPDRSADWRWALQASEQRELTRTGRRYHGDSVNDKAGLPWNADALLQDLELNVLLDAMAGDDDCIFLIARRELLCSGSNSAEVIHYRQAILRDSLKNAELVRELYAASTMALKEARRHYLGDILSNYPDSVLRWAVEIMEALLEPLSTVAEAAQAAQGRFDSEGWSSFFDTVRRELSPDFFAAIREQLSTLKRYDRELVSASLGPGNHGSDYVLHSLSRDRTTRWERLLHMFAPAAGEADSLSFTVAAEDENGHRALRELRNRGIAVAARALGRSAMHVRDFFASFRVELSFYVGSLNLHELLVAKNEPSCMPEPLTETGDALSYQGLYDPCLSLRRSERLVGNDTEADARPLIVITGANEGGKSTFLRSVGVAQLMMQSGMFVAAGSFRSSLAPAIVTHFRREEDEAMRLGKLEEELERMSELVDHATAGALVLLNESFSSTYEREGSQIALEVTKGLTRSGVRVVFVTHLFEFARRAREAARDVLFLRAERGLAGERTFLILPGEPLNTGFAGDLYLQVFGEQLPEAAA